MSLLSMPLRGMARHLRLTRYRAIREELEGLSDADLQDIGVKRYMLGSIARRQALR
jgi:uncharacterized protein YjiS (DUF1127 family)